jgi:phosphatidylglycerol lysyltransferase
VSPRAHRTLAAFRRRFEHLEGVTLWLATYGSRLWPALALGGVLWLTWSGLRGVHIREVRAALRELDTRWLVGACALTALNVAVMGLYDVVAFRHIRSPAASRWRYGAVAFAWSNFLTLGPLAGPAIRFWLYAPAIDRAADLQGGVVAIATAFTAGLAGWMLAVLLSSSIDAGVVLTAAIAFVFVWALVVAARWIATPFLSDDERPSTTRALDMALVGWLDWMIAAAVFLCVFRSAAGATPALPVLRSFVTGQVVGLVSLAPGGFGSADAYWIARLPVATGTAAAIVAAFRMVYYVAPWTGASLVLLSWATRRAQSRIEIARRVVAGLIGGGGILIMLSSASPALHARLLAIERIVPLPLVEFGQLAAAMTGLLLLTLAHKLASGYRAAFRVVMVLLGIGAVSAILKGFDWEEATVLVAVAAAAASHAALFDRDSHVDWIEGRDIAIGAAAVGSFLVFGLLSQRSGLEAFARITHLGYRLEGSRFARSAMTLALAVAVAAIYVALRPPVRFVRPSAGDVDGALNLHAIIGGTSTPLMIANGDKSIFVDGERGLCSYRIIGPYLVVFADPVVRVADRSAFVDALFRFASDADRRPLFYQLSPDWIPTLHDRGYLFFKLGEEAQLPLARVSKDGPSGKLYRQILRRGERDGVRFRVMPPFEVKQRIDELREISDDWLVSKSVSERQFSIGFFDPEYMARFPCAVVETADTRILAFANLLRGPRREELSVDLMRYRSDGPKVMDYLFASLFFYGKELGYQRFNLGMAPLASVGEASGAHARERLARLVFQHGEHWYNFRGLRFFKQKFDPDWVPRYVSYQSAWELPMALASVSALIAGGWTRVLTSGAEPSRSRPAPAAERAAADS